MICACEHIAHFEQDKRTPNGNPGHDYGKDFSYAASHVLHAEYGSWVVCLDCKTDCLKDYIKEEK